MNPLKKLTDWMGFTCKGDCSTCHHLSFFWDKASKRYCPLCLSGHANSLAFSEMIKCYKENK
jgi:hypothetical protein